MIKTHTDTGMRKAMICSDNKEVFFLITLASNEGTRWN